MAGLLALALIETGCAQKPAPAPPPVDQNAINNGNLGSFTALPVKKLARKPAPKKPAKPIIARTPLPPGFAIDVPSGPTEAASFVKDGKPLASEDAFLGEINTVLSQSLTKVPVTAPIGNLRLIMPVRSADEMDVNSDNPNGSRQYAAAMLDYQRMLDRYHDTAIEHSGSFQSVTVDSDPAPINDGKSDFTLWFRNGHWHLRYHEGDVHDIADTPDLSAWVAAVGQAAVASHGEGGRASLLYSIQSDGSGMPHFRFAGDDYASAADLAPAMKAAWVEAGDQVKPMDKPVGAKLKLVIPSHPKLPPPATGQTAAADGGEIRQADKAFYDAVTAGEIESIRKGGLFGDVEVKSQDVADVPIGPYDATLWSTAKAPRQWSFRVAGDDTAHEFAPPAGHPTMQEWVNALARQMRDAQKQPRS